MLVDIHCHTIYSGDSSLEPEELIHAARQRGLDAVCVTEHDSFSASKPVEEIARREAFLVFRGVEINTDKGHILAFGVTDDGWKSPKGYYSPIESVRPKVEACGGILIPAHPFRSLGGASAFNNIFNMDYITAIEVLNGENTERENAMGIEAWKKLGIPGVGGSDCHSLTQVGRCATWFERDITSVAQLIEEVRSGRVAPAYPGDNGIYKKMPPPSHIEGKLQ
ncbi:MAG: hypothetical protein Kow0099_30020 [Candidatus Abyssubacteria bacterium]